MIQGRVYAIIPPTEPTDQSAIQGMFLLSRLWARVLFDSGASHSFIAASVVRELGLGVETLEEPLYVSSPLGTKMSVDLMCRGCELEISRIILTVNLRVMDMSKFDVNLGMDWLTTLLGYEPNIQSDWNINAAEFKKFLSLNPPRITCVS